VITDDEVMRVFERADPALREPADPPMDATDYLESLRARDGNADVIVMELERVTHEPAPPRRWLVAAAAAAALVLLVGGVLVWSATEDDGASVPAGPVTTSTTIAPEPVLSRTGPPPSSPESSELVAAITFSSSSEPVGTPGWEGTWLNVYADGRLIRWPELSEQRLTADGVERVRQEFLATGLFDGAGPQPGDSRVWYSCLCIIRMRDGGRLLDTDTGSNGTSISGTDWEARHFPGYSVPSVADPQLDIRLGHLIDFVTDLESSLPPTAWAEREAKPYVPSKYHMAIWIEGNANQAVPDVSEMLRQMLPTPLVDRIDAQGWVHTPWADSVIVDLADVRELVEGLGWAGPSGGGRSGVLRPGEVPRSPRPSLQIPYSRTSLSLTPLLPDGQMAVAAPCPTCP
jgi:hypothetical protein